MRVAATLWAVGCLWLTLYGSALAQSFADKIGGMITDEAAEAAIAFALENVGKAVCGQDRHCPVATERERANPPISKEDAREIMIVGVRSALALWCEIDTDRSFRPMVRQMREHWRFNPRQLALAAIIHGGVMGRQIERLRGDGKSCPAELKAQLDKQLPPSPTG